MSAFRVEDLLRDADLVIDYAVRVGRLPDDSLPIAVNALKEAPADKDAEAVTGLISALNKAIPAIAPMTLVELRADRSPFHRRSQNNTRALQGMFCLLTIGLAALVADLTEFLHRQDSALRTLQEVQATHPLDKLNALRKMVQFDDVLSKNDSIRFEQYHRGVRELRSLHDKLSGAYEVLRAVNERGPYFSSVWSLRQTAGSSVPGRRGFEYLPGEADAANKMYQEVSAKNANKVEKGYSADLCAQKTEEAVLRLGSAPPWMKLAVADSIEGSCFAARLNLYLALPSTANLVYEVQSRMAALNGWVLPFFYGLLGASVFVMRNLLDPRTPTMWPAEAILRVALGGIAGIVIGWFWVPNTNLGEITRITSVPYGFAFLGGFSIDILFSILDRAKQAIADTPSRQAAQK